MGMDTAQSSTGRAGARKRHLTLYNELSAIASVELADVLSSWGNLSQEQADRLSRYLISEMGTGGLLSLEHGHETGSPMGAIRRDARKVLS